MSCVLAMFAALVASASGLREEMWGPADSVKAFSAIENALKKVYVTEML